MFTASFNVFYLSLFYPLAISPLAIRSLTNMPSHSMFTASFNIFYLSLLYFLNSSCNKIVNKYTQPLHVYRLLRCVYISVYFILLQ